jgi:FKBP-type peptidyl-prolyl cis-trans isomerase
MIRLAFFSPVLVPCLALVLAGCVGDDGATSPTVKPADPATLGGAPSTPAAPAAPAGSVTPGALAPATVGAVQTTYSGLKYEVLRAGTGARPSSYNRVKVHYHGYLPDGTVFDSSVQRGQPATFGLTQVIAGWREGIPLMQEGAKYRFTVPPHLAYGQRGMPPKIGPNQTLMFDVELLQVLY